mgnify:CR=1 FL=1
MERILIVEDEAAIADSLARFLQSEGFSVQTAAFLQKFCSMRDLPMNLSLKESKKT